MVYYFDFFKDQGIKFLFANDQHVYNGITIRNRASFSVPGVHVSEFIIESTIIEENNIY